MVLLSFLLLGRAGRVRSAPATFGWAAFAPATAGHLRVGRACPGHFRVGHLWIFHPGRLRVNCLWKGLRPGLIYGGWAAARRQRRGGAPTSRLHAPEERSATVVH